MSHKREDLNELALIFPHLTVSEIRTALGRHKTVEAAVTALLDVPAATCSSTARVSAPPSPPSAAVDDAFLVLHSMFPGLPADAVRFALHSRGGNSDDAAAYMLEASFLAEWTAKVGRKVPLRVDSAVEPPSTTIVTSSVDRDVKARLLRRYDEQVDTSDKTYRPALPQDLIKNSHDGKRVLKYSEGKAVFVKPGERFITEAPPPEDPSTFVSIKIKRKGKRGAGAGWGK